MTKPDGILHAPAGYMQCPGCKRQIAVGFAHDPASGPHIPNNKCDMCNGCNCNICKPETEQ